MAPTTSLNLAASVLVGNPHTPPSKTMKRIRMAVRLALEDEGYDVVEAESGEGRAVWRFGQDPARRSPSSTSCLPGMDGFEVCRAIRKISDVPIVMVTARSDTHDVVAGLEAGGRRLPHESPMRQRSCRPESGLYCAVCAHRSPAPSN